jgi:hypothetical protein
MQSVEIHFPSSISKELTKKNNLTRLKKENRTVCAKLHIAKMGLRMISYDLSNIEKSEMEEYSSDEEEFFHSEKIHNNDLIKLQKENDSLREQVNIAHSKWRLCKLYLHNAKVIESQKRTGIFLSWF